MQVAAPIEQFVLNDKQNFACVGLDFDKKGATIEPVEGIRYTCLGKLSEQHYIFKCQIENSLAAANWDFVNYPDPEIVIIDRL